LATKSRSRKKYTESPQVDYDPLRDFEGSPIEQSIARLAFRVRSNIRSVLLVVAVLITVATASILYRVWRSGMDENARLAFHELLKNPVFSGENLTDPSAAIARLENYEKQYDYSAARLRSAVKKLELYEKTKKFAEAAGTALFLSENVGNEDLKLYYEFRAASHFETLEQFQKALDLYARVVTGVPEDGMMKAAALFGKGRCLIRLQKRGDGEAAIRQMMDLKDVAGIEQLQILAASYLISQE